MRYFPFKSISNGFLDIKKFLFGKMYMALKNLLTHLYSTYGTLVNSKQIKESLEVFVDKDR